MVMQRIGAKASEGCKTFMREFDSPPRLQSFEQLPSKTRHPLHRPNFTVNLRVFRNFYGGVPRKVPRIVVPH